MDNLKTSTMMMKSNHLNGYHHHYHNIKHTNKSSIDQDYLNGQLNGPMNGFHHYKNGKISNAIHYNDNNDDDDDSKRPNGINGFIGNNHHHHHKDYLQPIVNDDSDTEQEHCPELQLSSIKKYNNNYSTVETKKNSILKNYSNEKNSYNKQISKSKSYYCSTTKTANTRLKIKSTPDNRFNRYEEPPYHIAFLCYVSYAVLIIFGYLRDFMRKTGLEKNLSAVERDREVSLLLPLVIYLIFWFCLYYYIIIIFFNQTRDIHLYIKVLNHFIPVIFIVVYVMHGIDQLQVYPVLKSMLLIAIHRMKIGHLSMCKCQWFFFHDQFIDDGIFFPFTDFLGQNIV